MAKKETPTVEVASPRPSTEKWIFAFIYFAVIGLVSFLFFKLTQSQFGGEPGLVAGEAPFVFRGWIGGWHDAGGLGVGLILSPINLVVFFSALLAGGLSSFLGKYTRSENIGLTVTAIFSGLAVAASTPWLSILSFCFVLLGAALFQLGKQKDWITGIRLANWTFERIGVLICISVFLLICFSSEPGNVWIQERSGGLAPAVPPAILWAVGIAFTLLSFTSPLFSSWEISDNHAESLVVEGLMTLAVSGLAQKLAGLFSDLTLSRVILAASLFLILFHFVLSFLSHRARPLWGILNGTLLFFSLLSARVGTLEYIPLFGLSQLFLMTIYALAKDNFPKKATILGIATFLGAGGMGSTLSSLYMASIGSIQDLPERMGLTAVVFIFSFVSWRLFWLTIKSASGKEALTPRNWILSALFILPLLGVFWTGRISGGLLGYTQNADLILPALAQWFFKGPANLSQMSDFQLAELDQNFMVGAILYWSAHVLAIFLAYWSTAVAAGKIRGLSVNNSARASRAVESSLISQMFQFFERAFPQLNAKIIRAAQFPILGRLELSRRADTLSRGVARFEKWSWDFLTRSVAVGVRATAKVARSTQVGNPRVHLSVAIWIVIILWIYFSGVHLKLISFGGG